MEELVAKRVAEELERRKDEIEAEVLRRVEEAKKVIWPQREGERNRGIGGGEEGGGYTEWVEGCWFSFAFLYISIHQF